MRRQLLAGLFVRPLSLSEDLLTLGIETSCDDTAAAVLRGEREVLADVMSSQTADHAPFGGVVPELASRRHQEAILPLIRRALADAGASPRDIGLIAVTAGPGLMGSLLVGVMTAKALSQAWGTPLIGVNHIEGHIMANAVASERLAPPYICLVVSGGHTELVAVREEGSAELLGTTRDDAAGEAYDKAAKLAGLGYPGGPIIDELAEQGDANAFDLPIGLRERGSMEFSFSGTKTAFRAEVERLRAACEPLPLADLAASLRRAVTDALIQKTDAALRATGIKRVAISGGVAANSELRARIADLARKRGCEAFIPPKKLCTDNAVMIAAAGRAAYARGMRSDLSLAADPAWEIWGDKA